MIDDSTNSNCYNCINCIGCINCNNCSYCVGCIDCSDCNECISCKNCHNCDNTNNSEFCKECHDCENCKGCSICAYCEEGIMLSHRINYYPFLEAKYSFPRKGCCLYNPLIEDFLLNQRFIPYDSIKKNKEINVTYISWNYGLGFRKYWIAKKSNTYKHDINSLLNFIFINKLYYNDESEVSIEKIILKGIFGNTEY